jgi:hypothetical protein
MTNTEICLIVLIIAILVSKSIRDVMVVAFELLVFCLAAAFCLPFVTAFFLFCKMVDLIELPIRNYKRKKALATLESRKNRKINK